MAGPILIFGRFATAPGFEKVSAAVEHFASKLCSPMIAVAFGVFSEANASMPAPINRVLRLIYGAKVRNSVVSSVAVNMVNCFWRLLTVVQKPSDAVTGIQFSIKPNKSISLGFLNAASNGASFFPRSAFNEPNFTRVGAIAQHLTNFLWNNQTSHLKSPLHLVRGLTVAAVRTPIIPRSVEYSNG